ncbi:MAG: hypothetical protein SNJ69_10540, partial [Chloroflexaceae bacterium]
MLQPAPHLLRMLTLITLALALLVSIGPARADEQDEAPPVAPVEQIIVRLPPTDSAAPQAIPGPAQAAARMSGLAATPLEYVRTLADGALPIQR